jgi:DNA helicase-2/ATP-dependent DNA helicase PcrA
VAENVDMRDLVDFARVFDIRSAGALDALVKFAGTVMTNVGADDLLNRVRVLKSGGARKPASDVEIAAINFDARPSYREAASLLDAINDMGGVRAHRPAILRGCYRMLLMCDVPNGPTPLDAATEVREQARLIGRPLSRRTVGSTLLLKGLEGDLSVILNPELMDSQHLYVAMTRGARGLVICSSSPVLNAA